MRIPRRRDREQALLLRHLQLAERLSPDARRHIREGFDRRVLMLDVGCRCIEKMSNRSGKKPLGPLTTSELSIHLNAYYRNLCGAIDNLVWAIQYEFGILSGITEIDRQRTKVALFGKAFSAALKKREQELSNIIATFESWHSALRELRDPAAHRVPIYAIPGTMNEKQGDEYARLQELSVIADNEGEYDRMVDLQFQAAAIGSYAPLMSLSSSSGHRLIHIWDQVASDHDRFLDLSDIVSRAVLAQASHTP